MSSFNINGPSNKPAVTEAQNMMNNGGGGNLGYMQGGSKKKKSKEEEPVLLEEEIEDAFVRSDDEEEEIYEDEQEEAPQKETLSQKLGGFLKGLVPKDDKKPEIKSGDFLSLSTKKEDSETKEE